MKIIIRKDLKMRKGKTAAQAAHALTKLFLEKMKRDEKSFVLSEEEFNMVSEKLKNINSELSVEFVHSEEELDSIVSSHRSSTYIVDHGRTEFHGVKTKTCAAVDLFNDESEYPLTPPDENRSIFAKQVFVFSKQFKLPEENAAKLSAIGSLQLLFECLQFFGCVREIENKYVIDVSKDAPLSLWLKGAFAKISLCVKTNEDLIDLHHKLKQNNIKSKLFKIDKNIMLAIEPLYSETIDPFTGELKLI